MARVGRLAGAIVAETDGAFYIVGNTKVPCDFAAEGFEPPLTIDGRARPFQRLWPMRTVEIAPPIVMLDIEGEALAGLLAGAFVIERTGSVSERLWRLVIGLGEDDDAPSSDVVSARWLGEVPPVIWKIVRDTVLRCS